MAKITTSSANIGLREFRENTEKYIAQLKKGKKFTILRHSKPVFAVVPASEVEYDLDELDGPGWKTLIRFPNKEGITIDDIMKALDRRAHGQDT
ncbi:type II toxin-antitoxin system prevent-host-death family antitoxin [Candidatus Kaiserbacteria bacterium]|nr:type II toxin-antitoxin system prevent-host-death family antitoxin [Candidatus Kaiserbacteria bacterium]